MEDSIYTCEKNHVFIEENNPLGRVVAVGGALYGVGVDRIGAFVGWVYLGQCSSIVVVEILKQLLMVDSLLKVILATGSQKFYKSIDDYSMTNAIGKIN